METDAQILKMVKDAIPETIIFANTGVNSNNVSEQLSIADGAVVGTTFKANAIFENHVDEKRVKAFMKVVRSIRG